MIASEFTPIHRLCRGKEHKPNKVLNETWKLWMKHFHFRQRLNACGWSRINQVYSFWSLILSNECLGWTISQHIDFGCNSGLCVCLAPGQLWFWASARAVHVRKEWWWLNTDSFWVALSSETQGVYIPVNGSLIPNTHVERGVCFCDLTGILTMLLNCYASAKRLTVQMKDVAFVEMR